MSIFSKFFSSKGGAKPPVEFPAEACLIDVRSPEEYAHGHIEGAVNIPLNVLNQMIDKTIPDHNTPLILCCRSGMRSSQAVSLLRELGYQNILNGGGLHGLAQQMNKRIQAKQ